jgi:hypothetical protein
MFESETKEEKEGRVEIQDLNKETVDRLLKWIYFGKLELKMDDFDVHLELYQAAHKYEMESLMKYLASQIVKIYTHPEKALKLFEFGNIYGNNEMIEMAKETIKKLVKLF